MPARRTERIELPSPAPGTARHLLVHRWGRAGARPKAYLQAAIHADELPAVAALDALARLLDAAEVVGEVVLVPAANPIGLSQQLSGAQIGRFAFDASGNFNRGYPDLAAAVPADGAATVEAVRAALRAGVAQMPRGSETEALKATLLGLAVDSDLVLDVHCDGEALLHLYASQHHRATAEALAGELGAAVCLLETDPGGTPFDEACARPWWTLRARGGAFAELTLACFATTIELRGRADVSDALAEADAAALLRFLRRRSVVAGDPGPAPAPVPGILLEAMDVPKAPAAGIVFWKRALGERVAKGDVLAEILDPLAEGAPRVPLASATDGLFFARAVSRLARPGQALGKVAGAVNLAHRRPGALLNP